MSETPFFDAVKNIGDRRAAAQAMLKALKAVVHVADRNTYEFDLARAAIYQAEEAGITTGEDK